MYYMCIVLGMSLVASKLNVANNLIDFICFITGRGGVGGGVVVIICLCSTAYY